MSVTQCMNEETIQERMIKDINYIKHDVITKINDKKDEYCKFSRPLNAITILNFSKSSYIRYWTQAYMKHPEEKQQIINACEDKFKSGLIPKEQMIELVENSKDSTEDKINMLKILKGEKVDKPLTQAQLRRQEQMRAYFERLREMEEQRNEQEREPEISIREALFGKRNKVENKRDKLQHKKNIKKS